jgi:cyclophilin family peptidyl-prolyl cis-trans isomerase
MLLLLFISALDFMTAAKASRETTYDAASLAPLLQDANPETRAMTIKAMSKHGAKPETFFPLLQDADWRVRTEAMRGAMSKTTAPFMASVLTKAWLELDPKKPGSAHPVLVGVEAAFEVSDDPAIRALFAMIAKQGSASSDPDQKGAGCLAAYGKLKAKTGSYAELLVCGDAEMAALLSAKGIELALGAPADRTKQLALLWKDPSERVRAAAAAAAVFAKSPIVDLALAAKETSVVAFAADAMARVATETKKPVSAAWLTKAWKRTQDPALEVDAKLSLAEALTANKFKVPSGASSQPASLPTLPFDPASARGKTWDLRVTTSRGAFTMKLDGRVAPFAAASFLHLARAKFFDGTLFHRVVANFVVQGGDPSGTGTTTAGYALPAEPSTQTFSRGAVGIADSGPGTGGSQWFIMHSRAPHLEGRYTWVGAVTEGMDVVDRLQVGDKIVSVIVL